MVHEGTWLVIQTPPIIMQGVIVVIESACLVSVDKLFTLGLLRMCCLPGLVVSTKGVVFSMLVPFPATACVLLALLPPFQG